ncbi:hypothetical protein BGZ72_000467 [Mortierella alpina]|nr:hypothetical protein BGZ72_000467 [Mortierella alpina]
MASEVLAIPELAAMVAQYLPQRDIAACKLTSRVLNMAFNPYLWKHIFVRKDREYLWINFYRAKGSRPLYRNRQYIETLNLEIFAAEHLRALLNITSADNIDSAPSALAQEPAGTAPHLELPRLKSLSIAVGAVNYTQLDKEDAIIPDDTLNILLKAAPNITSLTLCPEVLLSARFLAVLTSDLPHLKTLILRRLELNSVKSLPASRVLSALPPLFAKPTLTTLELDFNLSYREFSPAEVAKAMKELTKILGAKSVITCMVFPPAHLDFPLAFVKPLLESCLPQLQILNVPSIEAEDLSELVDVVRDHCPNVCELNLAHLRSVMAPRSMVAQVVRLLKVCKDLRGYHGYIHNSNDSPQALIQALLQHASTMESLFLSEEMDSSAFADLISGMPALRKLVVSHLVSVDVKGAISLPWAPHHLRRLEITVRIKDTTLDFVKSQRLHLDPELNPGLPGGVLKDEDLAYMAMRKFFKHLGELTELEELYLKHYYNSRWRCEKDWTLGVGLGFLGRLAKLRKLRLDYGLEHIGQAEVDFMYKHWPNLEEVYFHCEHSVVDKYSRPWAWLKARRPDLRYDYDTYFRAEPSSGSYAPYDHFMYCDDDDY